MIKGRRLCPGCGGPSVHHPLFSSLTFQAEGACSCWGGGSPGPCPLRSRGLRVQPIPASGFTRLTLAFSINISDGV